MLGAILGDIVGSRFEWNPIKTKDFELLNRRCRPTDDSVMTLAIGQALLEADTNLESLPAIAAAWMQTLGRAYPRAGYGGKFRQWLMSERPRPYASYGNGSAMRVSACGWAGRTLDEVTALARAVTSITHNHPEGMKGAEATSVCIWLARIGKSQLEIRDYVNRHYYPMDFALDDIRAAYVTDTSCQGSVPQAITAFLEAGNFEEAIRNAVSLGGDSDTIAAIAGSIAEAYFGIPHILRENAITFLDERMLKIVTDFEMKHPPIK